MECSEPRASGFFKDAKVTGPLVWDRVELWATTLEPDALNREEQKAILHAHVAPGELGWAKDLRDMLDAALSAGLAWIALPLAAPTQSAPHSWAQVDDPLYDGVCEWASHHTNDALRILLCCPDGRDYERVRQWLHNEHRADNCKDEVLNYWREACRVNSETLTELGNAILERGHWDTSEDLVGLNNGALTFHLLDMDDDVTLSCTLTHEETLVELSMWRNLTIDRFRDAWRRQGRPEREEEIRRMCAALTKLAKGQQSGG